MGIKHSCNKAQCDLHLHSAHDVPYHTLDVFAGLPISNEDRLMVWGAKWWGALLCNSECDTFVLPGWAHTPHIFVLFRLVAAYFAADRKSTTSNGNGVRITILFE